MTTDTTTRTGKVTLNRSTDPETGRTVIRAAVTATDLVYEVLGAVAELHEQAPDALTRKLDDYLQHRAEEIEGAGKDWLVREAAEKQRDVLDGLLELAQVAPDPTILLGRDEVAAIAKAHLDAVLTGSPLVPVPVTDWTHQSVGHPFGDVESAA